MSNLGVCPFLTDEIYPEFLYSLYKKRHLPPLYNVVIFKIGNGITFP